MANLAHRAIPHEFSEFITADRFGRVLVELGKGALETRLDHRVLIVLLAATKSAPAGREQSALTRPRGEFGILDRLAA